MNWRDVDPNESIKEFIKFLRNKYNGIYRNSYELVKAKKYGELINSLTGMSAPDLTIKSEQSQTILKWSYFDMNEFHKMEMKLSISGSNIELIEISKPKGKIYGLGCFPSSITFRNNMPHIIEFPHGQEQSYKLPTKIELDDAGCVYQISRSDRGGQCGDDSITNYSGGDISRHIININFEKNTVRLFGINKPYEYRGDVF